MTQPTIIATKAPPASGCLFVLAAPSGGGKTSLVKALLVSVGQEVKAGEALAMVEAMKMENALRAEKDVTIAKILAKEGDSLAVDAVIMEFA